MAGAGECIWISSRRNTCALVQCPPIHTLPSAHPSVHPSIRPSVPSIHPSIHPSILSVHILARGPFALCQAILIPIYHLFHGSFPFLSVCPAFFSLRVSLFFAETLRLQLVSFLYSSLLFLSFHPSPLCFYLLRLHRRPAQPTYN